MRVEEAEQCGHFLSCQHARNALLLCRAIQVVQPWKIQSQHFAVQKQDGTERLVVCERRNLPFIGQHVEKRLDLRRAHFARVPHHPTATMPTDEKARPIQVGLLRLEAIVQIPDAFPKLVQEPC